MLNGHRWELRLRQQEGDPEEDLLRFLRHDDFMGSLPKVTLELLCEGEVVFKMHSPGKPEAIGETLYWFHLVDGRMPLDVLQNELEMGTARG